MATFSTKGMTFAIGAVVALKAADFVLADFTTPLTAATDVGEPETLAIAGDEWTTEDFVNVTTGRAITVKTGRKAKAMEFQHGLDPLDAGQLAIRAACNAETNFAFRLTFADKPLAGAAPKNSTRLFVGSVVMVDDDASGKIGKFKFTIQPNSNIFVTHASAT